MNGRHAYNLGVGGRSIGHDAAKRHVAVLTCGCGIRGQVSAGTTSMLPPGQLDKKFQQRGWDLDPAKCPACITKETESKKMASKPTQSTVKAQAAMFRMLTDNFDGDAGSFATGWTDKRIAQETGLSVDYVTAFREEAFGKIKEPEIFAKLLQDIQTLNIMIEETVAPLRVEVEAMRKRVEDARKQFTA
jgi:hypothetical protein